MSWGANNVPATDAAFRLHRATEVFGAGQYLKQRLSSEATMRTALIGQTEQLKVNVVRAAREAEERLVHFRKEAVQMKAAISEAIEDRMKMAKRAVKHGYRATGDFVDDTTHRIKRDPLRAVGLSFVAGLAAGWILPHRTRG